MEPFERVFLKIVAAVLAITAFAKAVALAHRSPFLALPDPLFEAVSNRYILSGAVAVEVVTVMVLLGPAARQRKIVAVLWLCLIFWVYRMGLVAVGFRGYCRCLGSVADWLGMTARSADQVSLAVLSLISVGALCCAWLNRSVAPTCGRPSGLGKDPIECSESAGNCD